MENTTYQKKFRTAKLMDYTKKNLGITDKVNNETIGRLTL